MKNISLFLFVFALISWTCQNKSNPPAAPIAIPVSNTESPMTPEQLAQQQLDGYNARDIELFLKPYSKDIEIYKFPNSLSSKGKAKMRENYQSMFDNTPDLHCELVSRMVMGNTVIDQEKVTGFAGGVLEAMAIYKIENNKIAKVYFISKE